jgi:hypothetical protein
MLASLPMPPVVEEKEETTTQSHGKPQSKAEINEIKSCKK